MAAVGRGSVAVTIAVARKSSSSLAEVAAVVVAVVVGVVVAVVAVAAVTDLLISC
jgi:hypothetical protein